MTSSGSRTTCGPEFFGPEASTAPTSERLVRAYPTEFQHVPLDIRDAGGVDAIFAKHARRIELVVHAAAQPSHDWAAREPHVDFSVNAIGTLNLLEAARRHAPDATFVFCSTNKVYGDLPNQLPLVETETRWELPDGSPLPRAASTRRCRSTARRTRCSAPPRSPPT